MSILTPHGKTYSDSDNELVFGGQKVLSKYIRLEIRN